MEIHKHATQFKIDRKMLLLELAGNMIFRKSVCEPIAAAAAKLDCVFGAIRQRRVAIIPTICVCPPYHAASNPPRHASADDISACEPVGRRTTSTRDHLG
jgi:hypothetical protein